MNVIPANLYFQITHCKKKKKKYAALKRALHCSKGYSTRDKLLNLYKCAKVHCFMLQTAVPKFSGSSCCCLSWASESRYINTFGLATYFHWFVLAIKLQPRPRNSGNAGVVFTQSVALSVMLNGVSLLLSCWRKMKISPENVCGEGGDYSRANRVLFITLKYNAAWYNGKTHQRRSDSGIIASDLVNIATLALWQQKSIFI